LFSSSSQSFFTDLWGYRINWFDPEDGWDAWKRAQLLKLHFINQQQPKELPAFTKTGFKKSKIPQSLYQVES
jgi:hypothetical protein